MKRILAALLCALCISGSAMAADLSDIRGYVKGEDYQILELGTYPYEADGTVAPLKWRVLFTENNVATLITEYVIDVHQVILTADFETTQTHRYRPFYTFAESDLYAYLNGEMLDTMCSEQDFRDDLAETENGRLFIFTNLEYMNEDYGFPHTKAGTTVEQPGQTVVPAAKRRMAVGTPWAKAHTLYENWTGRNKRLYVDVNGCSPYWTATMRRNDGKGVYLGIIGKNGHISWSGYGSVHIGVRPAVRIDLNGYTVTGGSGTLEDPWRLEKEGSGKENE